MPGVGWGVLCLVACFSGVAALAPPKEVYRVGIDSAWAGEDLSPTFDVFLTSAVGSLYSPAITFSTSVLAVSASDPGSISSFDFLFARPDAVSCLEEVGDVSPLLTLKAKHGTRASALVGGVLFAKADNAQVGALADLGGKRVSSGGVGRGLAFLSVSERLGGAGVSLTRDASQLVFSPAASSGGVIADVLEGRADAGVVETGALEREAASGGGFGLAQVKVLGSLAPPTGFSLLTSTELFPQWGLVSMPNVDRDVTVSVAQALLSLNASSAQAVAGGFDSFTVAASYEPVRSLHAKQGLLDASGACKADGSDAYTSVLCPAGTYVRAAQELQQSCSECPPGAGYQCVCKPCVPGGDVDTFSDGRLCSSWELCGNSAPQGAERTFHVVDNLRRAGANFTYSLARAQGAGTAGACTYDNETERAAHRCKISLREEIRGAHTMRIRLNGTLVSGAIHKMLVSAGRAEKCSAGGLAGHFELNDVGECVCTLGALPVTGGGCMRAVDLIPIIVVLPAFIVVAFFLLFVKREQKRRDYMWKIDFSAIQVSSDSLGPGTFGQVLRGDYRGRPISIKRAVPTVEDMEAFLEAAAERRARNSIGSALATTTAMQKIPSVSKLRRVELPKLLPKSGEETVQDRKKATTGQFGNMALQKVSSMDGGPALSIISSAESLASHTSSTLQGPSSAASNAVQHPPVLHHQLVDDFVHEMRFVVRLRHPCIVSVIGGVLEKGITPLMVMQICDTGNLGDLIHNNTVDLDPEMALPILKDVVQGMHFLHAIEPPIVHGDLRAHKVLIDATFRAKVTDYGFSQKRRMGLQFSRPHMSPEMLIESVPTKSSDVYAFGMLMYEVLSRQEPYAGENFDIVLRDVIDIEKEPPKRPVPLAGLPENVLEMMNSCWHKHAVVRPSFEDLESEMKKMTIVGLNEAALKRRVKQQNTAHTLYEVFPKHIADQLVQGKKVAAERRPAVTIFFSDIVGFTDISGTFSPEKVSNMLDRLYTRFDALSEEFDVFKVETIGDAYMAVSNLVKDQNPDHCARIARFGMYAIQAANETLIDEDDPERGTVNIRVGFHTGPVVANVVGSKNPRYCLFGDTVTTASKMESNSIVNRVHCTRKAVDVLRQQAPGMLIEERGPIEIKGKGQMVTFWINGEDQEKSMAVHKTSATILFAFSSAANKFKVANLKTRAQKQHEVSELLGPAPNTRMVGRIQAKIKVLNVLSKIQKASLGNRVAPEQPENTGTTATADAEVAQPQSPTATADAEVAQPQSPTATADAEVAQESRPREDADEVTGDGEASGVGPQAPRLPAGLRAGSRLEIMDEDDEISEVAHRT